MPPPGQFGFLEHRRRAERALASVVATSYLPGISTRRVEQLFRYAPKCLRPLHIPDGTGAQGE